MIGYILAGALGFVCGAIVTLLRGMGRDAHYEATIDALEGQNKMLREMTFKETE
jgi:hypothetical protein